MPESFNPYLQWLDLSLETNQPDHYELLGLPAGESDTKRIALAAEQAATKVRSFRPGSHAAAWARLLDEIQMARLVLLDPARKAQYDQQLSVNGRGTPRPPTGQSRAIKTTFKAAPLATSDLYPPGFRPAVAAGSVPVEQAATPAPAKPAPAPAAPISPLQTAAPTAGPAMTMASTPVPASSYSPAWPSALPAGVAAPVTALYPAPEQPSAVPAGYALPVAQPATYPATGSSAYNVAMAPVGVPMGLPPGAMPMPAAPVASQPYGLPLSAMPQAMPVAIDPMAPVAIPGVSMPMPAAPLATGMLTGTATIPTGMPAPQGMMPQATWPAQSPSPLMPNETANAATPQVRKASAASVMLAARKDKQTRNAAMLAGAVAGLVVVAGLIAYAVIMPRLSNTNENGNIAKAIDKNQSNQGDGKQQATDAAVVPARATGANTKPGNGDVRANATSAGVQPMPMPMVEPGPLPMPEPKPEPPPIPALTPAPMPEPKPEPKPEPAPMVRPTRQQVAELQAALKKARLALSEQSFADAEVEIAKAEKLALTPEHRALVERLRLATEHVKVFRKALAEAVSQLDAAETIKVGSSTVVAIVETFPDKLTVRVNGMNRTYSLGNIPQGLAVAILDIKRVGGQPDSRLLKAMYVATGKDADEESLATARGWLAEAQGSDSNAMSLQAFLDDNYENLVKQFDEEEKNGAASAKTASTP